MVEYSIRQLKQCIKEDIEVSELSFESVSEAINMPVPKLQEVCNPDHPRMLLSSEHLTQILQLTKGRKTLDYFNEIFGLYAVELPDPTGFGDRTLLSILPEYMSSIARTFEIPFNEEGGVSAESFKEFEENTLRSVSNSLGLLQALKGMSK